jgi:hypothetical protein
MAEVLKKVNSFKSDYKIVVFDGLSHDSLIFSGNYLSAKKLYLPYDADFGTII